MKVQLDEARLVPSGNRHRLIYRFVPSRTLAKVQSMSIARVVGDTRSPVTLEFDSARMTVHRGGAPTEAGVQIVHDETRPARSAK